jgi:release factor glutamine methyltransferase
VTVHELVVDARGRLGRAGISHSEARLDAETLARRALGWDSAQFLTSRGDQAPVGFPETYDRLIRRRERREPTSYIVGSKEFWGLDFEVSSDVLIPRPETEFLVEEAIACSRALPPTAKGPLVVDVGTGSGCVAIALAREIEGSRIVATDISRAALHVARRNAVRHGVANRVHFVLTDVLAGFGSVADLIVSNPPYVPRAHEAGLAPEVRDYEPHVALFGGADGLEKQLLLLEQAATRLAPAGYLLFEFGDGQEESLRALIANWPSLRVLRVRSDLQGIPRTMVLTRSGKPV